MRSMPNRARLPFTRGVKGKEAVALPSPFRRGLRGCIRAFFPNRAREEADLPSYQGGTEGVRRAPCQPDSAVVGSACTLLIACAGESQTMIVRTLPIAVVSLGLLVTSGCSQARPSALTPGAAKKYIQRGVTSQAEVIEVFGTPNVITTRDGQEMWVYDKVSSRTTSSAFGLGGFGGGGGSGGFGGGGLAGGVGSVEQSETTVMLIIYYDKNDVVADYKITQTKF